MKKLTFLLTMLLTLGIGQVWAAEYTIKATDGFKSSYNETEATFEKEGVTYGYLAAMYNANNTPSAWYKQQLIQCRKHSASKPGGDVWNVTPLNISKVIVKLATSDKDFTLYYGSTEKPTSNSIAKSSLSATEETITYSGYVNRAEVPGKSLVVKVYTFDLQGTDASYFLLDNGNSANYIWEIIIQTTDGGGSDQDDCTTITPILTYSSTSLLTNSTATATLEGNTGNGDVTYTTSDDKIATVDADGTVTAVGAGSATITATVAAAGEYCDGTATAKITVTPLISCAEVYDLVDDATFALKEFVVTYANGKYTYIKDGTGYGLIFNNAGAYGLKAGDQVAAAELAGKKDTYNGLVEIIPTSVFADLEITSVTAPAPAVMNALPVKADMNKYVKFEDVTFASTTFSSKKVTGKINAGNITFCDQFATDATFNTSKKYDVIGAVSIYNSTIQVNFISAEEVAEPTLNVKITNADFGKIAINGKAERTLTLNGSLLTQPISLAIEGEGAEHFTLDSESVTPTDGNITDAKIKITYEPIAEGTHTATLKITSDDVDEQTITLTGQAVQQHTVHFFVNGEEQTDLAKKVLSGNTLEELPTATSCDLLNYPTFAGWTSAEIDGTTDVKPTMLDLSTPITSDCNYYAVFEKATVGGSSEEQTETITIENFKSSGDGEKRTCETNSATWTWLKNNASSTINVTYEEIRLYQYHSMTISQKEGCDISKIVVDINTGKPASDFAGNLTGATMSRNENTATLTPTSEDIVIKQSAQSRVNSFVVTYTTSTTTYEYITSCAVVVSTCEITYDYADGEGECTNDIVEEGAEYTLCATDPTKAGHTFLNWKDQHGTEYAAGATITSVTEDLTLTAQWQVKTYSVTWMSLGDEVLVNSTNYNTQPTKPATDPAYTCGTGKEFVGWTTQEIDGVGVPANLYTDEFPVVTEAITYHAVFASINSSAESTTHTLTPNNSWSGYKEGTITDDKGYTWSYNAAGQLTDGVYSLNLRNKNTETSYIGSPLFTANVKNIKATIVNGSASKARKVYVCSAPTLEPTTGDLGITEVAGGHSGELSLAFEGTISQFYLQVSDALQFQSIVVEVGADPYTDYTTSCPVLELTEGENTLTDGEVTDVTVNRSFEKDKLYTISLPFALDASQVETIFGAGTTLYQFAQLVKENEELVLYFSTPSAIAAATPYLIQPTQDVAAGFTVEDAVISTTPNNISFSVDATTITMMPILSADRATTNGSTEYWLAANRILYNDANTLLSLRALFNISTVSGMPPRCRVALGENAETGVDNIITTDAPVKVIENGQLIIIRNGEKYNVQGVRL